MTYSTDSSDDRSFHEAHDSSDDGVEVEGGVHVDVDFNFDPDKQLKLELTGFESADDYSARVEALQVAEPVPRKSSPKKEAPTGAANTVPIVLSKSITTTNIADLHELLQSDKYRKACLTPNWEFTGAQIEGFKATMKFVDKITKEVVEELLSDARYPTKKQAKEAAAGLGLQWVRNLPDEVLNRTKNDDEELKKDEFDYVSELHMLCQAYGTRPVYTDYGAPNNAGFFCELKISESVPFPAIETQTFGGSSSLHSAKKLARKDAAKEAILWIKSQPDTATVLLARKEATKSRHPAPGTVIKLDKDWSPSKMFAEACLQMGLEQTFQADPAPGTGIWDVRVIIRREEGQKPISLKLRNQVGKKNARANIAEAALNWIKKTESKRMGVTVVVK